MKKGLFFGLIIILLVATSTMVGCTPEKEVEVESPLQMALIPGGDAISEMERYEPIVEYLEGEIGREIDLFVCSDYSAVVVALKQGSCDIARLGPFSYVLAVQEAKCEIIASGVRKKTGKATYESHIIARGDSGIESLVDLKGRDFAFLDVGSATGYLLPMAMFKKVGIEPDEDLTYFFAGSHPAVIEAVLQGQVVAGATNDQRLDTALAEGVFAEGEIVTVAKSDPIPTSPTVVRAGLDPELKERIKQAYLGMPPELAELAVGTLLRYEEAFDSDFDPVRELAEILDLDLTQMD